MATLLALCQLLTVRVGADGRMPHRMHSNSEQKIALTFDDGPHKRYTAEILDILLEYGIPATFFVIGSNVAENPELVCRALSEGHEIGNHTYTHPHLTNLKAEELFQEMVATEELLLSLAEYRTKLFRPPEGYYSQTVSATLEQLNYIPVLWTVDTVDWRSPPAKDIASTVLTNTRAGVIILCHDYVSGKSNTPAALRLFIPELLKQGYRFVTVSELLMSD